MGTDVEQRRLARWCVVVALVLAWAPGARAEDEGLHAQLLTGFDAFLLHDPIPVRGGAAHAGADAFSPGPVPPIELHLGASVLPRLAFDLALGLRWAALREDRDVVRHDADFWLAARVYPWTSAGHVAPFAELGGGISSRSITRDACVISCRDRGAEIPSVTRALLVGGVGAEWYPGASGAHLLTRLDARAAMPAEGVGADVRLTGTVGVGWRWR